jgi:hypothetical protein
VADVTNDSRAQEFMKRQEQLAAQRSNFDSHWQEVARLVLPHKANFTSQSTPGQKRMDHVFDSTPISANERFAAAMQSMLTPATQRWHSLQPIDVGLEDDYEVKAWCDEVTKRMFGARYSPFAQFGQAIGEGFLCFGAFGNTVVFVDENKGKHLVYRAGNPEEFFFAENQFGVVDTIHRKFDLTARQCAMQFGTDKLPPSMRTALEQNPDRMFEILHVVTPREEAGYGARMYQGMSQASCYVSIDGKAILREGAYRSFPFAIGRYMTGPGEVYGRGPGMTALPDIKMLNEMAKTVIRIAQKIADPPLLAPEDGALQAFSLTPAAINFGAVDSQGRQLVHPLETGANLPLTFEVVDDVRKRINDVFHVSLFQILVEKPTGMTATEAMIRAQEKGALLAPVGQRAQNEFLGGLIARELDIMEMAGQLPPMPVQLLERGGRAALRVEYSAPVNQAQKAQVGVSILNYLNVAGGIAQQYPGVLDKIDFDEMMDELADVNGVPTKIMRTPEGVKAIRDQRTQQQDLSNAVAAAPQIASAAKDLSTAQANAGAQPSTLLPLIH